MSDESGLVGFVPGAPFSLQHSLLITHHSSPTTSPDEGDMKPERQLDDLLAACVAEFVARNGAARTLKQRLDDVGGGLFPLADHLTFRRVYFNRRAEEFLRLWYRFSETLQFEDWFGKWYRTPD